MSSFIPMVSSSPPPMDEGGGFDWEEDDDDEFGGFASAEKSNFEPVESHPPTDWNQSNDSTQPNNNDEFADFSAFESNKSSFSEVPKDDGYSTNSDIRPGSISFTQDLNSPSQSNTEVKDNNKDQDSIKGQVNDSNNGTLTDSGMFSSEVSPVPRQDEQPTVDKKYDHSDSLDDVLTESLSENIDINVNSEQDPANCDKLLTQENTNDCTANLRHNDVKDLNDDSVIGDKSQPSSVQDNIPSDKSINVDSIEDSILCSNDQTQVKTSNAKANIPIPATDHSLNDFSASDIGDSGNICKTEDVIDSSCSHDSSSLENDLTNEQETTSESIPTINSSCCLSQDKDAGIVQNSHEIETTSSDDLHAQSSDIPETNDCVEKTVDVENYVNDQVISEAVKKVSNTTSNDANISLNSCTLTYQCKEESVDTENMTGQKQSESGETHSSPSGDFGEFNVSAVTNQCEQNLAVENQNDPESCDDFGHFTSEVNVTENKSAAQIENTIPQSDSRDSSPVMLREKDEVTAETSQSELNDVNRSENNKAMNNDSNDGEDFGDFSTGQGRSEILSHGSSSSDKNSLNEVVNNVDDDFGDFSGGQNKSEIDLDNSSGDKDSFNKAVNNDIEDDIGDISDSHVTSNFADDKVGSPESSDFADFGESEIKSSNSENTPVNPSTLPDSKPESGHDDNDDEFGDFGDFSTGTTGNVTSQSGATKDDGFANFSSNSTETTNDDWAAFGEPQTSFTVDNLEEEDDWGDFGDEPSSDVRAVSGVQSVKVAETQQMPTVSLQNMSKHEKLVYAVSTCFPNAEKVDSMFSTPVDDLTSVDGHHSQSKSSLWVQIKSLQSSKEVSYYWTKSEWNSQLFTTLHIDTRNVLIGHKKAPVPIFAAGLTMLEPVKGPAEAILKPAVLVDTVKSTDLTHSNSQETIPPAQFDWTGSGLTNPLEANNKTLNLDFLIQDQSAKSSELESEFLGPDSSHVTKPAIQPLENILANLKTTSTYKPANQEDNISKEAQKVVHSLPNLSFMKSRVLMFPLHME